MMDKESIVDMMEKYIKENTHEIAFPSLLEELRNYVPEYYPSILMMTGISGVIDYIKVALKLIPNINYVLSRVKTNKWIEEDGQKCIGFEIYDRPIKYMKEKALFLDLDGTLIRTKSGSKYPENIDDWEFMSRKVLIAIKKYKEEGFHICIVANDGGIELGHYSKEQITTKLDCISKELEQYIGQTVNYAFCGNMESYMRKPNPGMAYRFALELELNLRNSVMVGNSETDAKFAKNAFIGTYLDVEDFMKEQFVREYSTPDTRPKQK